MPKRILRGKVTSLKNANTAVVVVERTLTHTLLNRTIKRTKKYHVDFSGDDIFVGGNVLIQESIVISKLKRWTLLRSPL
jgi:small subunit ribosomal protein S17